MSNKQIRTAEDIGMTANQLFGQIFMGDTNFTDDEQVRIMDWFSAALEGRPVGELQIHRYPLPEFAGEIKPDIKESK